MPKLPLFWYPSGCFPINCLQNLILMLNSCSQDKIGSDPTVTFGAAALAPYTGRISRPRPSSLVQITIIGRLKVLRICRNVSVVSCSYDNRSRLIRKRYSRGFLLHAIGYFRCKKLLSNANRCKVKNKVVRIFICVRSYSAVN